MLSTRQLDEGQQHLSKPGKALEHDDQPYAIIWLHGKELKLFEDAQGNFFTA